MSESGSRKSSDPLLGEVLDGCKLLKQRKLLEARMLFREAARLAPDDPVIKAFGQRLSKPTRNRSTPIHSRPGRSRPPGAPSDG